MRSAYILMLVAVILCSCKKDLEVIPMMESRYVVHYDPVINANEYFSLSAEVINSNKDTVNEYGFVYTLNGTGPLLGTNGQAISFNGSQLPPSGKFQATLDASIPDYEYSIRAYVVLNHQVYYSTTYHYQAAPRGSWKRLANFPGPFRTYAISFSVNNKGYVGLGLGPAGNLKDFWEFDPSTNQWTQLPDFPGEARSSAFQFTIGNKAYVGGGAWSIPVSDYDFSGYCDFYEFDPQTRTWKRLADYPVKWPIGLGTYGTYSFSAGGYGFVGGGRESTGYNAGMNKYDPATNQWSYETMHPKNYLNEVYQIVFGTCFVLNDTVYIGAGFKDRRREYLERFFSYDYKTKTWAEVGFPSQSKAYAFGTSNSNTGLVGFGEQTQEIWQFSGNNRWKRVSRCPDSYGNKAGIAFTIGNKTYVGLGAPLLDFLDKNAIYEYTHTR